MNAKIENGILTVTCPVDKNGVISASGKSKIHASTHGFVAVSGSPFRLSVNLIS